MTLLVYDPTHVLHGTLKNSFSSFHAICIYLDLIVCQQGASPPTPDGISQEIYEKCLCSFR